METDESIAEEGIAWGDSALPLIVVEVRPCCPCSLSPSTRQRGCRVRRNDDDDDDDDANDCEDEPALTAAFIKMHLLRSTLRSLLTSSDDNNEKSFYLRLDNESFKDTSTTSRYDGNEVLVGGDLIALPRTMAQGQSEADRVDKDPFLYFPTNDPTCTDLWPCRCRGYVRAENHTSTLTTAHSLQAPLVTKTTLVRLHPATCDNAFSECRASGNWKHRLTGEMPQPFDLHRALAESIVVTQNPAAVREWTLRMKQSLAEPVDVGTTVDALEQRRRRRRRHGVRRTTLLQQSLAGYMMSQPLSSHSNTQNVTTVRTTDVVRPVKPFVFRDGALLLHSPDHGAGKTYLTEWIAHRLGARTHIVRLGALLAKYGVYADTALQCLVHAVAIDAALQKQPLCILLDDFNAVLSTGSSSAGDAANPIIHGMVSYLHTLTTSVRERNELPFPTQQHNPLYNLHGKRGVVLSLRLCLVLVLTCPDGDPRLAMHTTFQAMGTYRLPSLTSSTRLEAMRWALSQENIVVVEDAERLPWVAAAAVWARGAHFGQMARAVRARCRGMRHDTNTGETVRVTLHDVKLAMSEIAPSSSKICDVQFLAHDSDKEDDLFGSVGGCQEAKMVLEDSLALDPVRRKLLLSFGLSPPTGILLYGPPGVGKTLLAKAVAKLLRSGSASSVGGAFISLSSTDIVRATVGTGERMVISAFQTARLNSPAVVFIDEFQALFTERGGSGSSRLTTTLLQCMDDVKLWSEVERSVQSAGAADQCGDDEYGRQEKQVLVLAATNTPWMIDKAFLRPGRFDRVVHVDLPSLHERTSILLVHIGRMRTSFAENAATISNVCERIAEATAGYSGAGLAALCRAAAIQALSQNSALVEEKHFWRILKEGIVSQTSPELVQSNKRWRP